MSSKVIVYFAICWWTLLALFLKSIAGRKVNSKVIDRIKKEGLYHITRKELVSQIVDDNNIAHFIPSKKRDSYSNYFRRSVFFFIGKPNSLRCWLNLPWRIIKHQDEFVALRVNVDKIPEDMLKKFKWRVLDAVAMYGGCIDLPVEIEKFSFQ